MTEQLKDIGRRIKELREIFELTLEELAQKCELTPEEMTSYEAGEKDFSFSLLYNVANMLNVDVLDLMSGESPKLSTACLVTRGGGYEVRRRKTYSYKHLAFTFRDKMAEPFMVTVEYSGDDEVPTLHEHDGQEFNYVVEGSMKFYLGDMVYTLEPGDSIYFNSGAPHAMKALTEPATSFLAVVMKKGG